MAVAEKASDARDHAVGKFKAALGKVYANPERAFERFEKIRRADDWKYALRQARGGKLDDRKLSAHLGGAKKLDEIGDRGRDYLSAHVANGKAWAQAGPAKRSIPGLEQRARGASSDKLSRMVGQLFKDDPGRASRMVKGLPKPVQGLVSKALDALFSRAFDGLKKDRGRGGRGR